MGMFPYGGAFSIDGVSSDTWLMYIRTWTVAFVPGIRSRLVSTPGRVGKKSGGTEIDSRMVSLELSIFSPSQTQIMRAGRAFSAALDPRTGPHQLIMADADPMYYLMVEPASETPAQSNIVKADFTVQLEAADPHWYSITPRSYSWAAKAGSPLSVDNVNGNVSTPPTFTITGPTSGTATGIIISYGSSTLTYHGTIVSTDTVVINCNNMTITKNGINDIGNWGGDDFPYVPVGAGNTITWSDTNNVGANVTVAYTERCI